MRGLAWVAALLAVALAPDLYAQDAALRLEMLTERIAKLQAQLGQGVLVERSNRAMPEALRGFDAALREAQARSRGAEARENYVLLALLWKEYRAWAMKAPTRDNAKKLAERAEEVAWIAAKGARLLAQGRSVDGALAQDAALAATLSQRLARLHLMRRWEVRAESASREIPAVTAELQRTLEAMRAATASAPELATEVHAAQGQFEFLVQAGRESGARRPTPHALEFIAKSADHMLESMERIARLGEAQ